MKKLKLWAFQDILTGDIMPPDVCPIMARRGEARAEKNKHKVFYSNTRIVPVIVTLAK